MEQAVEFPQMIAIGCGLDVHKEIIVATIFKNGQFFETKEFRSTTSSLTSLRDWLKTEKVTDVAMESTGVYWKPVYNILEEDFKVMIVNARHIKNIPGHKTDKKDSAWIAKLLVSGLLRGSFVPPKKIRQLRDLVRYMKKVTAQIASEKNRIIKYLEDANLKLSSVLSNVDGATGTKVINDLIAGVTDVNDLLKHYHGKINATKQEFKEALVGTLNEHHRFMLQITKDSIADKEKLIQRIEAQIDEMVKEYQTEVELLQTIPGVGKQSAITIISEIGVDMSKFATEQHLSSWSGMSPGNNESGGKKK